METQIKCLASSIPKVQHNFLQRKTDDFKWVNHQPFIHASLDHRIFWIVLVQHTKQWSRWINLDMWVIVLLHIYSQQPDFPRISYCHVFIHSLFICFIYKCTIPFREIILFLCLSVLLFIFLNVLFYFIVFYFILQ